MWNNYCYFKKWKWKEINKLLLVLTIYRPFFLAQFCYWQKCSCAVLYGQPHRYLPSTTRQLTTASATWWRPTLSGCSWGWAGPGSSPPPTGTSWTPPSASRSPPLTSPSSSSHTHFAPSQHLVRSFSDLYHTIETFYFSMFQVWLCWDGGWAASATPSWEGTPTWSTPPPPSCSASGSYSSSWPRSTRTDSSRILYRTLILILYFAE